MSENTMISSQIQMKKQKNQSIDQNTLPVPNSSGVIVSSDMKRPFVGVPEAGASWVLARCSGLGQGPPALNLPWFRGRRHYRGACLTRAVDPSGAARGAAAA